MKRYIQKGVPINLSGETVYVGIDVHKVAWDVTIRTEDVDLSSARIPGTWECLEKILIPYRTARKVKAVYEGGFSGFWLYRTSRIGEGSASSPLPAIFPRKAAIA